MRQNMNYKRTVVVSDTVLHAGGCWGRETNGIYRIIILEQQAGDARRNPVQHGAIRKIKTRRKRRFAPGGVELDPAGQPAMAMVRCRGQVKVRSSLIEWCAV